jgi:alkylation response protein AidB-like acyl-CoA dehydrogenase
MTLGNTAGGNSSDSEPQDLNALSDQECRLYVRQWVEANHPDRLRFSLKRPHLAENRIWYDMLANKGWIAPSWPREYGGLGLSSSKQLIMLEEFERHGCARLNDMGPSMLGPLLIRFGSEPQKRFFLPKILSGEHIWCQGYSEPNAGSDLASLRTEAVLDGEEWIVNGQKTWATLAQDANWMFMLVRTDKNAKKQEGISFLLVPMNTIGITVRPILTIDLHDEFAEVFFDNVRVPKDNLVGELNKGWSMAKALLGFERILIGSPKQSAMALGKLRALARHLGVQDDPSFKNHYVRLEMDLADLSALYEGFADKVRRGESLGPDVSMLKVYQSELYQRITDALLEVAGENAGLLQPRTADRRLNIASTFLQARPATIYGGSSEIQRDILAKAVVGLPSS